MIRYSSRSRVGYARLYRVYNDVDVYVEDSTYIGVYEKMLNRALNGKAKIQRVIPLGTREFVVEKALKDTELDGRRRLYIVDGDLDLIAWERMKSAPHLYRLQAYSIENVLFELEAVERYCTFAMPARTSGAALSSVSFDNLMSDVKTQLAPYVTVLGIARRLKLRDAIFSINPPSISRTERGKYIGVDKNRCQKRIRQMISKIISEVGLRKYRITKGKVLKIIRSKNLPAEQFVPGKSFLIWYLNHRVGYAGGLSHTQPTIVSYLAEHCTLRHEPKLSKRLRAVASG